MTTIRQEDLITSVADALQFISYYHPLDYIQALGKAYEREQSPAARDAIATWARLSYGFMGRTPEYKAAFMASLGANPEFYTPFAGNALATVKSADAVKVITVRTTAFDAVASGGTAAVDALGAAADTALRDEDPQVRRTAEKMKDFVASSVCWTMSMSVEFRAPTERPMNFSSCFAFASS